jgi:hypothetical protein
LGGVTIYFLLVRKLKCEKVMDGWHTVLCMDTRR